MTKLKFMLLNLPNPPKTDVFRDNAGGFGTAFSVSSKVSEPYIPIYLLYAASALERFGCEYKIIDAQANGYDIQKVKKEAMTYEPDILLAWISLPSLYSDLAAIDEIKRTKNDILAVAWGSVCNMMPEEVLFNSDVDLILKGEYPYYNAILEFVKKINKSNMDNKDFDGISGATFIREDRIISNNTINDESESLNNLLLEIYHKMPVNRYLLPYKNIERSEIMCIPIVTSVGCPHGCVYCPYPVGFGHKVRYKSTENIIKEIEFLMDNFKIRGFLFRQQAFMQDKKRFLDLCNGIIEKNLDIKWIMEARADHISKELLQITKKAGCFAFAIGVDTGSPKLLNTFGRGISLEQFERAFQMCKEVGIYTQAHIIVGLPGENKVTIKDTINFLHRLDPDSVDMHVLAIYPGTRLFEIATKKGWISTPDWSKHTGNTVVIRTEELTEDQLYESAKRIKKKFRNFKLLHDSNFRKYHIRKLLIKYKISAER